ncbi:Permease of the drug/metabolite transporter (DMT) superfamily [Bosea robiniae]|uniref:Permease of the drug/metabolite transporter (DMT) superfamily n=2 Tax=Bosea robiniae TaxID=1036780 RepID=A0ABY0P0Z0_9HYPH|nr:Permease of the drug/metabolite transporter (DMT) superfamily [Bosea robiniae]
MPRRPSAADHWLRVMSEERQSGRQGRPGFEGDAPWHEPAASAPPAPGSSASVPIVETEPSGGAKAGRFGWLETRRQRLRYWWRGASPNLRGSVFMLAALLVYAVMVAGIKHVGQAIPLAQILLIRQVIMTAILLLFAAGSLRRALHTDRLGLQVFRSVVTLLSMLCGFTAVVKIPLAQATAIGFSQVLFVTIAAVLVLKEVVDIRRWTATAIGFVGVLIMLRPSSEGLDIYAMLAVAGAICGAAITVSVRKLAASERTDTILLYQGIVLIVLLAVPTWAWWQMPTPNQWFWLITLSVFGTAGQWLITRAYQVGEAAALAPLDFSRLLLASFTGFVFFAEIPALTTWLGAAIVIGATLYTIRKNARTTAPPPAAA